MLGQLVVCSKLAQSGPLSGRSWLECGEQWPQQALVVSCQAKELLSGGRWSVSPRGCLIPRFVSQWLPQAGPPLDQGCPRPAPPGPWQVRQELLHRGRCWGLSGGSLVGENPVSS